MANISKSSDITYNTTVVEAAEDYPKEQGVKGIIKKQLGEAQRVYKLYEERVPTVCETIHRFEERKRLCQEHLGLLNDPFMSLQSIQEKIQKQQEEAESILKKCQEEITINDKKIYCAEEKMFIL
jgi:hypothetical protein